MYIGSVSTSQLNIQHSLYLQEYHMAIRGCSLNMGGGPAGGFRQIFREKKSGPPSNFVKNSVPPPPGLAPKSAS